MPKIEKSPADQEQPIEVARLQEVPEPRAIQQEQQTSKNLDSTIFLDSFQNEISPTAVISVEQRPDEAIVVHCNNLYEYLKFGYREDQTEVAKIEKYKEIFNAFSTPETVSTAMQLTGQLPEEDRAWIMDKLNAEGSAVPVEFKDGKKGAIVMMNDMPTRRMLNSDGSTRNEDGLQKYDRAYKRTVEHEVRHAQYYNKYGKDMEAWRRTMESLRPLTAFEQRKYHYNRYTKDEVCAHIENSIKETEGKIEVDWDEIMRNLQKDDYSRLKKDASDSELGEYGSVSTTLVAIARDEYNRTRSIDAVMDLLASVDVEKFMNTGKVISLRRFVSPREWKRAA